MVKYLKYIVIVFGGIGLLVGSFFYLQNKRDIEYAWAFEDQLDRENLLKDCPDGFFYPCIKKEFSSLVTKTSLTGTSMGLKIVFNAMELDKESNQQFSSEQLKDFYYSVFYLEINNLAMAHVYRNYNGYEFLYGGFVGSLPRFYQRAYEFSENIINGLAGPQGTSQLKDSEEKAQLVNSFEQVKNEYFQLKSQVNEFIEKETKKLSNQSL